MIAARGRVCRSFWSKSQDPASRARHRRRSTRTEKFLRNHWLSEKHARCRASLNWPDRADNLPLVSAARRRSLRPEDWFPEASVLRVESCVRRPRELRRCPLPIHNARIQPRRLPRCANRHKAHSRNPKCPVAGAPLRMQLYDTRSNGLIRRPDQTQSHEYPCVAAQALTVAQGFWLSNVILSA